LSIFGVFGLQALEPGWIKSRQIESGRRVLTRYVRRYGRMFVSFLTTFVRAAESRMGSGKGTPEYWVAVVKPGKCSTKSLALTTIARNALRNAGHKCL
jgi:large subunit ribosomal protein L16